MRVLLLTVLMMPAAAFLLRTAVADEVNPVSKIVNPDPMPVPPAARTQRAAARRHYDSAARLLDAPAARETTKQFFAREAKARAADALGPAAGEQRVMSYASTFSRTPSALW